MDRAISTPASSSSRRFLAAGAALACALGCANLGKYTWVEDYAGPTEADAKGYVIAPGDFISVRVYNQEGMSTKGKVRVDGKLSLPFLNDVQAAGYTPGALAAQLQTRLKEFVNLPVVTVSLEEARPVPVSVVGEVAKQGQFPLEPGSGLLQLIAMAGGLNDFAHKDRIFVVRQPGNVRIRFRFQDLAHADGRAAQFVLKGGDVVVVE